VNDNGQVVGDSYVGGQSHAFSWTQAGGMVDLGLIGGPSAHAYAVNASGQVAGRATDHLESLHAFSWTQAGGIVDLGTLGGSESAAYALNAQGQIVGYSWRANGTTPAFVWTQAGGMVDLGTLGGRFAAAVAVNNNCQAVGQSSIAGEAPIHATFWSLGSCAPIQSLVGGR
jgi:probable HAF family extracellular repeat protein